MAQRRHAMPKRTAAAGSTAMIQEAIATRRLLKVTAGNIKNKHLYIREPLDFFPADCIGRSRRGKNIEILLDGLNQAIQTDICVDAKSGKPRFFRRRDWVGPFFKHHGVVAGDVLDTEVPFLAPFSQAPHISSSEANLRTPDSPPVRRLSLPTSPSIWPKALVPESSQSQVGWATSTSRKHRASRRAR